MAKTTKPVEEEITAEDAVRLEEEAKHEAEELKGLAAEYPDGVPLHILNKIS